MVLGGVKLLESVVTKAFFEAFCVLSPVGEGKPLNVFEFGCISAARPRRGRLLTGHKGGVAGIVAGPSAQVDFHAPEHQCGRAPAASATPD